MSKKLLKDKSLYTIKKLHEKTNNGLIYENDYTTIIRYDGLYDEMPLFSDSNFKYKIKNSDSGTKRHVKLDWLLDDEGVSAWTKSKLSGITETIEPKIELKPNYTSLKDFAYYGSAVELIKTTITDIMLKYPGGLCYYGEKGPIVNIDDEDYYLISNECQIDCWSDNVNSVKDTENPMRYLSYSYENYMDNNGNTLTKPIINIYGNCLNSIIGTVKINDTEFFIYKDTNNQNHLVCKTEKTTPELIIKPKEDIKNKFWNSLDGFEKIILSKEVIFDTPYMTDAGYYTVPQKYTWPTISGDNFTFLDLSTYKFNTYIESLYELANFHDEYDSDNIWRMMTHESIKNLDLSYVSNEDIDIDNSRIKKMIHIQGRQYDEIKRYIDGIKNGISVSYNGKNNIPDYFLSDIVENNGWESKNIYSPCNEYTSDEVNNEFLRRLILNSKYIQSMKGTKKGIEAVLGLFGFNINGENKDVIITEYYAKVENGLSYSDASCLRGEFDYINADEMTNYMEGYPVALVEEDDEIKLYPWYDKNEKYIGDFYYQCKGGWGKTNKLKVSGITGDYIYSETEPYMLFLNNLKELTSLTNNRLREGMICYVSDITGIEKLYKDKDPSTILHLEDFSNYFILGKIALSTELGYVKNSKFNDDKCYGWLNIKNEEFEDLNNNENAQKVIYLETILENTRGNNPHTGMGEYDFGLDYLLKYKNLFREFNNCYAVDKNKYEEIKNFGFKFEGIISGNTKIHDYTQEEDYDGYKIINIKNITIRFPNATNDELKKYIIEKVLPYVEIMIPSTSIVEYLFGDDISYITKMDEKLTANNTTYNIEPADVIMPETTAWVENDTW